RIFSREIIQGVPARARIGPDQPRACNANRYPIDLPVRALDPMIASLLQFFGSHRPTGTPISTVHRHSRNRPPLATAERHIQERTRLWLALAITILIAGLELVGGYLTNSLALMSDAGHMLTDVSALGLSVLALVFSSKPANLRKTYGYLRLEILSALVNGVLLLAITAVIAIETVRRFSAPPPHPLGPRAIP